MTAKAREERLAAALRENLKRRKAHSRAVAERAGKTSDSAEADKSPRPDAMQTPDGRQN
jgi:hypothetical protein